MKRYLVLLAALLLVFPLARAQQGSGDPRAMIFRGKLVAPYTFLYNGNYFWDHDPEYTPGDIFYNGRRFKPVHCAGLLETLALGCRASEAMHAD